MPSLQDLKNKVNSTNAAVTIAVARLEVKLFGADKMRQAIYQGMEKECRKYIAKHRDAGVGEIVDNFRKDREYMQFFNEIGITKRDIKGIASGILKE